MNKLVKLGIISVGTLVLIACSGTQPTVAGATEENASVSAGAALSDEGYVAYRNAHPDSPAIPGMIVTLARKHLNAGEYLLSRFYLNEYRRDFPSGQERARMEYLGLRSLYLQYRSMQDDRIGAAFYAQAKAYRQSFPHSSYRAKVRKLERAMHRIQNKRYRDLAKYYARIGKAKAAAIYQAKISDAGEVSSGK